MRISDWSSDVCSSDLDPAYTQACAVQKRYFDPADAENNAGDIPGDNFTPEAIAHMRAQVHNDARGWDAPAYALTAESEPPSLADIKGNFTHEETNGSTTRRARVVRSV